ncbi:hypothetical protein [Parasitella parasitica]|uniref:SLC41A/MgtE integral membrane domain-containing protein n=1 Tax=Parasitella parasitica TaxID=35722 RepID=A0A0B7NCN0_9FUNG|nr:hypothetical protein [Parasitella parasitica]
MEEAQPLPLRFQLLFHWEVENAADALLKHRTRMYPAFKAELNNTPIYRLIHHEFERHYISAGQLFKANGITLTEGLFLFDLKMTDFEVDFLVAQFPYCDIWVTLDKARNMAVAFGVEHELGLLLGAELDACFSSDNTSRDEMMHNWIIPTVPHFQYSTRALLEATFASIEMAQPSNRKIRTQISRSRQKGMVMKDRTESGLVRWQVWAYEQFLQQNTIHDPVLDRSGSVWDALQGILCDLQTLARGAAIPARVLSDNMMLGNMPLKKEYLNQSLLLQQLYTAVMAEKIMNEIGHLAGYQQSTAAALARQKEEEEEEQKSSLASQQQGKHGVTNTISTTTDGSNNNMLFHDRMDLIEQELYRVKRKSDKRLEAIEESQQDLISQLDEFHQWKAESDRKRKMPNDAIELLSPGDFQLQSGGQQKRLGRHTRSASSSSSFIHFKAPQQKEQVIPNGNKLASQALPSLLICVVGLIAAGWMMDIYQVFTQVSELFILVPVLLNLKGNLEMNLAARFSTSANMGDLDHPETRNALVWGNMSLIQVQALISGSVAGSFSVLLGALLHPDDAVTVSESVLVVASSMVSASVSSFVLGLFMCVLIIISRILKIDPGTQYCLSYGIVSG